MTYHEVLGPLGYSSAPPTARKAVCQNQSPYSTLSLAAKHNSCLLALSEPTQYDREDGAADCNINPDTHSLETQECRYLHRSKRINAVTPFLRKLVSLPRAQTHIHANTRKALPQKKGYTRDRCNRGTAAKSGGRENILSTKQDKKVLSRKHSPNHEQHCLNLESGARHSCYRNSKKLSNGPPGSRYGIESKWHLSESSCA